MSGYYPVLDKVVLKLGLKRWMISAVIIEEKWRENKENQWFWNGEMIIENGCGR